MSDATELSSPQPAPAPAPPGNGRRKLLLRLVLLVVVLAALGWAFWYFSYDRWHASTDDAYVDGNVVQITPRIAGTVIRIGADDNDLVRQGQALVELDRANADVALARAEAALGQAVRKVSGLYGTVRSAEADVALRQAALQQARADLERRQQLAASGAISREELAHVRDAVISAQSALAAAQAQLAAARAQTVDTDVASHPDVRAAAASLRQAWLDDQRTNLPAPVTGYVAKRTVQLGQHVQPGTPLMAVVPLAGVWVNANFKETQLAQMRIGQPVTLTADVYGDAVTYHGRVAGLGVGTGSAFSLLPAQNATGNWIKIVQRLPVRITLQPEELARHPLRIGLSMEASVDLREQTLPMLATEPPGQPVLSTDVYASDSAAVDRLIAQIVAQNAGATAAPAHPAATNGH